jgi:hypothetical protein
LPGELNIGRNRVANPWCAWASGESPTAESLLSEEYYVFLVESAERAKLICGFNEEPSSVRQIELQRGEFQLVVAAAIEKSKAM